MIEKFSQEMKGFKVRSEIDRAFYFHLFHEVLKEQFGLKASPKENEILKKLGSTVSVS